MLLRSHRVNDSDRRCRAAGTSIHELPRRGVLGKSHTFSGWLGSLVCRVEVLYTDGLAARVSVGGNSYTIEDASLSDLRRSRTYT